MSVFLKAIDDQLERKRLADQRNLAIQMMQEAMPMTYKSPPDVCTIKVRPAGTKDIAYVGNSLAGSYAITAEGPESALSRADLRKLIRRRMAQGFSHETGERKHHIDVAVDPENDDLIMGWVWYSVPFLHYVFVREHFRHEGIALQLLAPFANQPRIFCSHWTHAFETFARTRLNTYWRI